jgi:hypothetical protein
MVKNIRDLTLFVIKFNSGQSLIKKPIKTLILKAADSERQTVDLRNCCF